jgi:hypothetical protein
MKRKETQVTGKQLGWLSIILAVASVAILHFAVEISPRVFVAIFFAGTAAAVACAVAAALRASRWWFVAAAVIVLHTASLTWKIIKG